MLKLYQLHSVNSKDFGAVLLFETLYFDRPLVCSAKDSVKDGHAGSRHGLKLEKVGPTFSRFNLPAKITKQFIMVQCALTKFVWYIFYSSTGAFRVWKTRGVTQQMFIRGGSAPSSNPLYDVFPWLMHGHPFIYHFSRKRYPFRIKQPAVAFGRSPNLRDILVRAKLANIDNTSKPPASTFRLSQLQTWLPHLTFNNTGETRQIKHHITSDSTKPNIYDPM